MLQQQVSFVPYNYVNWVLINTIFQHFALCSQLCILSQDARGPGACVRRGMCIQIGLVDVGLEGLKVTS